MVDSTPVPLVNDQRMNDIAVDPVHPIHPPEADFGLWLLVSRQRGGARRRGGGSRVPRVFPNTAADPCPNVGNSRGVVSRSTRGGKGRLRE